ncbi:MAG TPA: hypothetical protein VF214_10075, partial [Edaphobacter sp.]
LKPLTAIEVPRPSQPLLSLQAAREARLQSRALDFGAIAASDPNMVVHLLTNAVEDAESVV